MQSESEKCSAILELFYFSVSFQTGDKRTAAISMCSHLWVFIIKRDSSLLSKHKGSSSQVHSFTTKWLWSLWSCWHIFLSASKFLRNLKQASEVSYWEILSYLWIPNSLLRVCAYTGKSGNAQHPLELFLASP